MQDNNNTFILRWLFELVNQSELLNMSIACNNAETCFRGVVPGPLLFEAQAFIFLAK